MVLLSSWIVLLKMSFLLFFIIALILFLTTEYSSIFPGLWSLSRLWIANIISSVNQVGLCTCFTLIVVVGAAHEYKWIKNHKYLVFFIWQVFVKTLTNSYTKHEHGICLRIKWEKSCHLVQNALLDHRLILGKNKCVAILDVFTCKWNW